MSDYKIIDQWYVGFNSFSDYHIGSSTSEQSKLAGNSSKTFLIGFMTPDGDDSLAKKRKDTVDKWRDNTIPTVNIDSTPRRGFKLHSLVGRYSRDSNQDKWKVVDPLGFLLEITSTNFVNILKTCDLVDGEFQGEFVWLREGAQNRLVSVDSEDYKELLKLKSVTETVTKSTKIGSKDLVIGYDYKSPSLGTVKYIGRYYTANMGYSESPWAKSDISDDWRYGKNNKHSGKIELVNCSKSKDYLFLVMDGYNKNAIYKTSSMPKLDSVVNTVEGIDTSIQKIIDSSNGICEQIIGYGDCIFSEEKIVINNTAYDEDVSILKDYFDNKSNMLLQKYTHSGYISITDGSKTNIFKYNRKHFTKYSSYRKQTYNAIDHIQSVNLQFDGDFTKKYDASINIENSYYSYTDNMKISKVIGNATNITINILSFDIKLNGKTYTKYVEDM